MQILSAHLQTPMHNHTSLHEIIFTGLFLELSANICKEFSVIEGEDSSHICLFSFNISVPKAFTLYLLTLF